MSAKKSAKPSAFYTFENPQVHTSADLHFIGGLSMQWLIATYGIEVFNAFLPPQNEDIIYSIHSE